MKTKVTLALLAGFTVTGWAEVPQILNYQGRISVSGAPFTGTGQFRFALVTTNGVKLWSNDGSSSGGLFDSEARPVGFTTSNCRQIEV